jgi:hypothetical protein
VTSTLRPSATSRNKAENCLFASDAVTVFMVSNPM